MTEDTLVYVPILKWRQGEYQALLRLNPAIKNKIVPLIVIPPVEYDFEERKPKKTIQEHIEPFAKRYTDKWGSRKSLIDLHESIEESSMEDGSSVIENIFKSLRLGSCEAIPVVKLSHSDSFIKSIKKITSKDNKGAAFRIKLQELMNPTLDASIKKLAFNLNLKIQDIDLIIDLEVPKSFEPYDRFGKALSFAIKRISMLKAFRSFVVAGMSLNLSEIKKPGGEPTRHDWFLYQCITGELADLRKPAFGDYTIETPEFISLDMRLINPAGKIVYTTEATWFVSKGNSFRDNRSQMIEHCNNIVNSGYYCRQDYSRGDKRIHDTLHSIEGTGNQGTWKEAGISHHITLIVNQLAKYHAS